MGVVDFLTKIKSNVGIDLILDHNSDSGEPTFELLRMFKHNDASAGFLASFSEDGNFNVRSQITIGDSTDTTPKLELTDGTVSHFLDIVSGDLRLLDSNDSGLFFDSSGGNLTLRQSGTDLIFLESARIGLGASPPSSNATVFIDPGMLALKETTTPVADTDFAKIYSKSDNCLYWQD